MESDQAGLAEDLSLYSRSNEKSLKGFEWRVYKQGCAGDVCTQEQSCAHVFPTPCLVTSLNWSLEVTHGGIYTMEIGECCLSGIVHCLGEPVVKHLPAHHGLTKPQIAF